MRKAFDPQLKLGGTVIEQVVLEISSRHELVPILRALQHIYTKPRLRDRILSMIEQDVLGGRRSDRGANGMDYWELLVLAAVHLGCDYDYDELADLADNHRTLRLMMGLDEWGEEQRFPRSTIHENITKLRTETLCEIIDAITEEGHRIKPKAAEEVRGDGFVPETNVHYPTDASLMEDGLRVTLRLATRLAKQVGVQGWRQNRKLLRKGKKLHRRTQRAKKNRKKPEAVQEAYSEYINHVRMVTDRALDTVAEAQARIQSQAMDVIDTALTQQTIDDLVDMVAKAEYVCELAERRVLKGEAIPNQEKIFSLFETHTELINRGKTPNPIEFGRRVVVVEDAVGFIVEHRVLDRGQLEQEILIPMMTELQERLNNKIRSASFDRGFYTRENREQLSSIVELACLPKKGKLSGADKERESHVEFRRTRKRHPGIESAIHALVAGNGLGRCRDRSEVGYKRYVALAVLGRNLHTLGRILLEKDRRKAKRQKGRAG